MRLNPFKKAHDRFPNRNGIARIKSRSGRATGKLRAAAGSPLPSMSAAACFLVSFHNGVIAHD